MRAEDIYRDHVEPVADHVLSCSGDDDTCSCDNECSCDGDCGCDSANNYSQ